MNLSKHFEKFDNVYGYLFFAILVFALAFLRKPETLLNAQLWAEDGKVWLAGAYALGPLKSLLVSDGGYFQTFSRIFASVAVYMPLAWVPLFFNSAEFLLQLSPALFFLTSRFRQLAPKLEVRLLFAILYILLPNTAEMDGHLTSSQWYLAVLAFLVLIAEPAKNKAHKIFDSTALLLSGLSGTFAIFLTPIAFILWYKSRQAQSLLNFFIVFSAGILQSLSVFVLSHEDRLHVLPQLTLETVFAIFSRQVVFGALAGAKGYLWLLSHAPFAIILVFFVSLISIGLVVYSLIKAPLELKLLLLFGLIIFLASLVTPTQAALSYDILKVLSRSIDGIRYWFIPMLGFASVLVWGLGRANRKIVRLVCGALLIGGLFGVVMDFRHYPYPDANFNFYAEGFEQLKKGASMVIPITPPGWSMELIKR